MKKTVKSERPGWVSGTEYAALRDRSVGWVTKQVALGMPHEGGRRNGRPLEIPIVAAMEWEAAKKAGRSASAAAPPDGLIDRLVFYKGLYALFTHSAFATAIENVGLAAGLTANSAKRLPGQLMQAAQQHAIANGPPI